MYFHEYILYMYITQMSRCILFLCVAPLLLHVVCEPDEAQEGGQG